MSWKSILIAALALFAASAPADAGDKGKYKTIHVFCEAECPGFRPVTGFVSDGAGNLYGSTYYGNSLYKLTLGAQGRFKFTNLYNLDPARIGDHPYANLIIDTKGALYGVTLQGGLWGHGAVFKAHAGNDGQWHAQVLYAFCPANDCSAGGSPTTGLSYAGAAEGLAYDGTSPLYGTTEVGGVSNRGTVYVLKPHKGGNWDYQVIHEFCADGTDTCADGWFPESTMVMDAAGALYGTTLNGGGANAGIAFRLAPARHGWNFETIHAFCSETDCTDGGSPLGKLAMDAAGALYGVAGYSNNPCTDGACGVLYKLALDGGAWHHTVLHTFCREANCRDGASVSDGVTLDAAGNIFGVAGGGNQGGPFGNYGGIVYELSGSDYTVLHRFCAEAGCTDGAIPRTEIFIDPAGRLFGTASYGGYLGGGDPKGEGVVFQINR